MMLAHITLPFYVFVTLGIIFALMTAYDLIFRRGTRDYVNFAFFTSMMTAILLVAGIAINYKHHEENSFKESVETSLPGCNIVNFNMGEKTIIVKMDGQFIRYSVKKFDGKFELVLDGSNSLKEPC